MEEDRDYIAAGKKLTLLMIRANSAEEAEIVGKIFRGVEMELVYTSIYYNPDKESEDGDPFERIVRKRLNYFQPNWISSHLNI